jgi:hypothetical protein
MGGNMKGECFKCKTPDVKVWNTFGKLKCKPCIEKGKTKRAGHSGMVHKEEVKWTIFSEEELTETKGEYLELVKVKKSNPLYVRMYLSHYPKSKGIVGRQLNYIVFSNKKAVGIIGVSSPPLNYKKFRSFFNTKKDTDFVNNNVFRITKKIGDKNLGTKILKMLRRRVVEDYKKEYNTLLLGIVTFVEPPRTGSVYKADNWEGLGMTQGVSVRRRGEDWLEKQYIKDGVKKYIFGIKFKHTRRKNEQNRVANGSREDQTSNK